MGKLKTFWLHWLVRTWIDSFILRKGIVINGVFSCESNVKFNRSHFRENERYQHKRTNEKRLKTRDIISIYTTLPDGGFRTKRERNGTLVDHPRSERPRPLATAGTRPIVSSRDVDPTLTGENQRKRRWTLWTGPEKEKWEMDRFIWKRVDLPTHTKG